MTRRSLYAGAFVALGLACATAELNACGDKFLRLGQSGRHKSYAAVHRASILIYVPAGVTGRDVKAFESALKRARHRAQSVSDMSALVRAVREREFDVVITGIGDAERVRAQIASLSSGADILPVASKAADRTAYRFVIDPDGPRLNPLATIDDLMDDRLARARAGATLAK